YDIEKMALFCGGVSNVEVDYRLGIFALSGF
mgnify:CR=1